ncbi:MAG: poly-gamma-glutamate synthase PgsB [Chlamydiae bacterium]|nr:poly-gamma-glutamate synthase PgsB [Chlamydiota bacterium]MBI3277583.1 poly-gamma-glutamate synthase PgsB [Chlamydiota bacterium]
MPLVLTLIFLLVGYGISEYFFHFRNRNSIPLRIHVNGTRGKSSVTRLITAGLREGGFKVLAKTTGTEPRVIFEDGSETQIYRPGSANIIEQVKFFSRARSRGAKAVVVECMALQPVLQWLTEDRMVCAQIGVITNVRPDHMDVMGETLEDVARALSNTIPLKGKLFTAESNSKILKQLEDECQTRSTEIVTCGEEEVSWDAMRGFSYIEHRENVALALKVCQSCGVESKKAFSGMVKAIPDPGVLRVYQIHFFDKDIQFVNAFAANDPDSTLLIWKLMGERMEPDRKKIVMVNARADRIQRSEQMGILIAQALKADAYLLVGDYTKAIEDEAIRLGLDGDKIENLGGQSVSDIFEQVLHHTPLKSMVFAIGNIGGLGQQIVDFFKHRGASDDRTVNRLGTGIEPYIF